MFDVLIEWFGQDISIPVIVCDLAFLALGIITAMKVKKNKTIICVMLTMVLLYLAAVIVGNGSNYMLAIYAVYISGVSVLVFVGSAIGLLVRAIKK